MSGKNIVVLIGVSEGNSRSCVSIHKQNNLFVASEIALSNVP